MSGGSYNYLYSKEPDELLTCGEELAEMRNRLKELGAADVAVVVDGIIATITRYRDEVEQQMANIADVLQAVEWLDSNDRGEDQVQDAVAKYRSAGLPGAGHRNRLHTGD
jgi:hypothetical protein